MDTIRKAANLRSFTQVNQTAFYIAARFGRQAEAREISEFLERMGYPTTSSWVNQVMPEMFRESDGDVKNTGIAAQKDLNEVKAADVLLYLSEKEDNVWGRGGRHVEFGAALAFGKTVLVIGPLENLFHYLPEVLHFDKVDDFVDYIMEESK